LLISFLLFFGSGVSEPLIMIIIPPDGKGYSFSKVFSVGHEIASLVYILIGNFFLCPIEYRKVQKSR